MNSAIQRHRPVTEEISAVIERVTFHNEDSDFCVLRVKPKGHREETTVAGSRNKENAEHHSWNRNVLYRSSRRDSSF